MMAQYIVRRLLLFIPTMFLATLLVFALFWIVPGDAAMMILTGDDPEGDTGGRVTTEELENLRIKLGLDRPIYVQYGEWVWDLMRGDLGVSIWYREPIASEMRGRFVISLELAVLAILMGIVVAVPLGIISAVKQDTIIDYVCRVFALVGVAMPTFWIAILVVYGLVYFTGWLPPLGYASLWGDPLTNLQQMVFPAMALSFHALGFTARVTRSSMLEVLREDYVRTARSKGLREQVVLGRHALKNALLPVVTISGYQFAGLLGGVIIIEAIFVVPGVGTYLIDAIVHRDFVVLQGVVVLTAAVVLVLNLAIDLVYGILDPRIRYQ
jgi:peptide/nickel transport system permease protein